jgi:hypothetical protein
MLKQSTVNFHPFQLGEEALNASRQFWLAGLGAAALTSDWVQTEATRSLKAFKSLVKEGTVVESRAVSFVGDRIEFSMNRANRIWSRTRHTVESTVRQAADTAVTIANSALPKSLPRIELPLGAKPKAKPSVAKAGRARKAVRKGPAKTARKAKRAGRTAAAK